MKKIVLCMTLLALTAYGQSDPYEQLSAYDFGKDSAPVVAITKEVFETQPAGYAAIETKLLAVLKKPDATYAAKKLICEQLRIVGSEKSVEPLLQLLSDERTAILARFALETLPGKAVDAGMLNALKSASGSIQIGLIQSLAARRTSDLAGVVKDYLNANNADLVRASLHALVKIGDDKAVETLESAKVADDLQPLRERALVEAAAGLPKAKAIAVFEREFKTGTSLPAVVFALNGLVDFSGNDALPVLIAALKDSRDPLALAAAKASPRLDGAETVKELCAALPALKPAVQVALIGALAERGDKSALPAVKALLASPDDAVKAEAALALQKIGDASAVPELISLATGEGDVAAAAQQSLGRINADGVNAAMLKMLDDADAKKVRVAALTLKARADRSILPRLLTMAASDKAELRGTAFDALDGLAGTGELDALLALLDTTKDRERLVSVIWKASTGIGKEDERFLKLWNSGQRQQAALVSLASIAGGAEPLKIAVAAAASENAELKEAAARTLFNWKTDAAIAPVVEIVKTTGDAKLKILGARAVARLITEKKCNWKQQVKIETLESLLPLLTRPEDKKMIEGAIENVKAGNKK